MRCVYSEHVIRCFPLYTLYLKGRVKSFCCKILHEEFMEFQREKILTLKPSRNGYVIKFTPFVILCSSSFNLHLTFMIEFNLLLLEHLQNILYNASKSAATIW